MVKNAMQEGNLYTMMFTTEDEYTKYIESDGALERRTQVVKVDEPKPADTLAILKGLRNVTAQYYDVEVSDEVLEDIVAMGGKYVHNRNFPDKGVDILDRAASVRYREITKQLEAGVPHDEISHEVSHADVVEVVAAMAKLPKNYLSQDDNERFVNLGENMKGDVFGQDEAIDALADAVTYAKAGLREPHKPVGSYLFVGPTGVGKTEAAKSLAKHATGSEENLVRIDMAEFMEKHSVSRLVGAPPGYVGYGEEGILTGEVRRNPNAVVVFDEIEKAHPDVIKALLGVMDDGRMKDGRGREINFQNATLIMTSNLGAQKANEVADKPPIGFMQDTKEVDRGEITQAEVDQFFPPEFLGRLDGVIKFNELNKEVGGLILNLQLKKLGERMTQASGAVLEFSDKVRETLMEKGFNPRLGARPLKQAIDKLVGKPLAKWLMTEGKDVRRGQVLKIEDSGDNFSIEKPDGGDLLVNPGKFAKPEAANDAQSDILSRLQERRKRRQDQGGPTLITPTPDETRKFGRGGPTP